MTKTESFESHPVYKKVAAICLALPDTSMDLKWGSPYFCVNKKIFVGFGADTGEETKKNEARIGLKLELEHADLVLMNPARFQRAKYVGHKGWVSMLLQTKENWKEVESLILESYRLIAPKRSIAKLQFHLK